MAWLMLPIGYLLFTLRILPTHSTSNPFKDSTENLLVLCGDCDRSSDCLAEEVRKVRIVNVELRIGIPGQFPREAFANGCTIASTIIPKVPPSQAGFRGIEPQGRSKR